ncbi:putative di- and tripeptidase DUG2 [Smittium mucronatum]|uniref:Putative di-and tripeptidase DUG2 n=1 Tax=Smittium mucronatum TaxID=133383 RepID=A0A1R0GSW6_9FUNG|nr:putative di- and tripeptidase DUG2 [Smittium mucronatum]
MTSRLWSERDIPFTPTLNSQNEDLSPQDTNLNQKNSISDISINSDSPSIFRLGSLKCIQEVSQCPISYKNSRNSEDGVSHNASKMSKSSEDIPTSTNARKFDSSENEVLFNTTETANNSKYDGSVLSLSITDNKLFSGSQDSNIYVWDLQTFQLIRVLSGHTGGIMCLALDRNSSLLFSGSADGTIRVWDVDTLSCLYKIVAGSNSGSILSIVYVDEYELIVIGCQNSTIQWFSLKSKDDVSKNNRMAEILLRKSKFFEGTGNPEVKTDSPAYYLSGGSTRDPDFFLINPNSSSSTLNDMENVYIIFDNNTIPNAHYGYVNSLYSSKLPDCIDTVLFSSSSDNSIKIWKISDNNISLMDTLELPEDEEMGVLSIAIHDELLFTGLQGGEVLVWDLEIRRPIRFLKGHTDDVLSIVYLNDFIYTGSYDGTICAWTNNFEPVFKLSAHDYSHVLSMVVSPIENMLVSGSSHNTIKFWRQSLQKTSPKPSPASSNIEFFSQPQLGLDSSVDIYNPQTDKICSSFMITCLDQWISFKSVSGHNEFQKECRSSAKFLKDLAFSLGASESRLLAGSSGRNPLVYFRFDPNSDKTQAIPFSKDTETIVIYGHYDVVPAGDSSSWDSFPFSLKGKDGYLYGRGVTDNKGPVLSMLFSVYELYHSKELSIPVVFLIEGEEENLCEGLDDAVKANSHLFGKPKLVLLSSSYWIGENKPCLTYGMRGNIRVKLEVDSLRTSDVHSGVWGGASNEPLIWLTNIISKLTSPNGKVNIPGFNDLVDDVTPEEHERMNSLVDTIFKNESEYNLIEPRSKFMTVPKNLSSISNVVSWPSKERFEDSNLNSNQSDSSHDNYKREKIFNQLMHRWRYPTLSIHKISLNSSSPSYNFGLIPPVSSATISMRTVPSQTYEHIADNISLYVKTIFTNLVGEMVPSRNFSFSVHETKSCFDDSSSHLFELHEIHSGTHYSTPLILKLEIKQISDWWLANTNHMYYKMAADIISKEWDEEKSNPNYKEKSSKKSEINSKKCGGSDQFYIKKIGENQNSASMNLHIKDGSGPQQTLSDQNSGGYNNSIYDSNTNNVLLVREGGSIPAVPWLEKFFGGDCVCMNIPMGQSSDNAHLPNERIRLVNLIKGRSIVKNLIYEIGKIQTI